jgi:thiamine biosynthesis lipoprotein
MRELAFRAMGSQMLAVIDRDDAQADAQLAAVPGWFEAWEQQLSRFRADSDLARLNAADGQPVVVSSALWQVIGVALDAAQQSDGLVRPTMLDALEAAGYDRSFDTIDQGHKGTIYRARTNDERNMVARVSAAGAAERPPSLVLRPSSSDWRTITLDKRTHAVTLPAGVRLDLGGVAKGWAADQAMRRLAATGPALVDAGGDIAVSGPMADGAPWPIAIANPFAPQDSLGLLLLVRGAVATSGRDYRHWRRDGVEQHHIIDPRTGRPAQTDVLAATIVAPDGPSAEVAAKIALIVGSRAGLAWLDARPTLAGLLVLQDGQILRNRRMDAYLDQTTIHTRAATTRGGARREECSS